MTKKRIRQPQRFDWSMLEIEMFRGPNLSFPTSMDIVVAPSFNLRVLSAASAFIEDFTGHSLLDEEGDSFEMSTVESIIDMDGTAHILDENSFGLHMKYMCGTEKLLLLPLGKNVTWH